MNENQACSAHSALSEAELLVSEIFKNQLA
jgi:hypothetical protein